MTKFECNSLIIGERLKEVRRKSPQHFTQVELAEELGISVSLLSKLEEGDRSLGLDILSAYVNQFNVDPNYLLGYSEAPIGSIDARLSKLCPKVRRYLEAAFITMIDEFPE